MDKISQIKSEIENNCNWMYETVHVDEDGSPIKGLNGAVIKGQMKYTVWSDVFVCPHCGNEFSFGMLLLITKKEK